MSCKIAKKAWTMLEEDYVGTTKTLQMHAQNLQREFELIKMKESQSIEDYIDQVSCLANQMRLLGDD